MLSKICLRDCCLLSFSVKIPPKSYFLYWWWIYGESKIKFIVVQMNIFFLQGLLLNPTLQMPLTPQIGSSISPTTVSTRWSICKSSLTQIFQMVVFSTFCNFPPFLPVGGGADDQENANKPIQNICECWIKKLWHALCKQNNVGSNKCKQGYKYRQAITLFTTRRLARKMATSGDWKLSGRYNHFHFHCHLHFYSLWTLKLTFFDLTLIESPQLN